MIETTKEEDAYLELFLQPGWKLLSDQWREARQMLVETCHTLETERALWRRKGEIQKLDELIAFEALIKMQIEHREQQPEKALYE